MRLARLEFDGEVRVGVKVGDGYAPTRYGSMLELIQDGAAGLEEARRAAEEVPARAGRLLAPIARPGKLLFSGINYRSHLEENPSAVEPAHPTFFAKLPSAVIGPGEPVVIPTPESQVDYEVELAVVIGSRVKGLSEEESLSAVFGYTIVNDVSERSLQRTDITLGKGLDTFCPLGPEIVLPDELPDPSRLRLISRVNGEVRQSASTADMVFSLPRLLSFLNRHITLEPGDVVSTGTPAGVGLFRQPPSFLQPGDEVVVEVDPIGMLTNRVVAGW